MNPIIKDQIVRNTTKIPAIFVEHGVNMALGEIFSKLIMGSKTKEELRIVTKIRDEIFGVTTDE